MDERRERERRGEEERETMDAGRKSRNHSDSLSLSLSLSLSRFSASLDSHLRAVIADFVLGIQHLNDLALAKRIRKQAEETHGGERGVQRRRELG